MSFGTFIQETLQKHTKDDVVDTRAVAEDLGFCISETRFSDAMVKGRISPTDDPYYLAELTFNATNNDTEDNTLVPLLVGQTMIAIGNNESIRASQIDAFFLSDMRRYRTSPHMLLSRISMSFVCHKLSTCEKPTCCQTLLAHHRLYPAVSSAC